MSYVISFPASQVFYFLIPRSATFSLTNLANCRFSRFATKRFTWFSIATFFVHNQIKLPMRRSEDEKLCLKYLTYLQSHITFWTSIPWKFWNILSLRVFHNIVLRFRYSKVVKLLTSSSHVVTNTKNRSPKLQDLFLLSRTSFLKSCLFICCCLFCQDLSDWPKKKSGLVFLKTCGGQVKCHEQLRILKIKWD